MIAKQYLDVWGVGKEEKKKRERWKWVFFLPKYNHHVSTARTINDDVPAAAQANKTIISKKVPDASMVFVYFASLCYQHQLRNCVKAQTIQYKPTTNWVSRFQIGSVMVIEVVGCALSFGLPQNYLLYSDNSVGNRLRPCREKFKPPGQQDGPCNAGTTWHGFFSGILAHTFWGDQHRSHWWRRTLFITSQHNITNKTWHTAVVRLITAVGCQLALKNKLKFNKAQATGREILLGLMQNFSL